MRFALFVLPFLSALSATAIAAADPARPEGMESLLGDYQAHESRNFLAGSHVVIHQGDKRISGFGAVEVRQGWKFDFVAGRIEPGDDVNLDSCRYQGYDCYWVNLAGKKYYPENTDSISVNGYPGRPEGGTWRFRVEEGAITAFSRLPGGSPDSVHHGGRGFSLAKGKDRKKFRDHLREVPEAHAAWNADPLGALRQFNRAPEAERVSDTSYKGASDDAEFPAQGNLFPGDFEKRVARNANDVFALGRLSEHHCARQEYVKAAGYAEKIRGINPDHFRYHLVRAYCEEKQGNRDAAIQQYEISARTAPHFLVPGIFASIKRNTEEKRFDSLYVEKRSRTFFFGAELGFGMPYAILGAAVSLNARFKGFMLGLSLAEGVAQGASGQGMPALGFRFFLPGEKWIPYLGFWDFAVFDAKIRDPLRYIGAGAGLAFDIGEPFGFRFHFGGGRFYTPSYLGEDGDRVVPEVILLPHVGFSYVF